MRFILRNYFLLTLKIFFYFFLFSIRIQQRHIQNFAKHTYDEALWKNLTASFKILKAIKQSKM